MPANLAKDTPRLVEEPGLRQRSSNHLRCMEPVELRSTSARDYDFVFSVHCAAMRPSVEEMYGWDADWQARYFRRHFDPTGRQIIRHCGTDVGYISVEEQKTSLFLSSIAILPAYQSRGIGTNLIRRLQQKARTKGIPVTLQVLKGNRARALYERLGFKVTGETDTHYRMKWSSTTR